MRLIDRLRAQAAPNGPIKPWKDVTSYVMAALTVAPGVLALLAGGRVWRIVLAVLTVVSLVLAILRLVQAAYSQQLAVLQQELLEARGQYQQSQLSFREYKLATEQERDAFTRVIDRIVDYQVWSYSEELELVVLVENDKIIEHHTTTPLVVEGRQRLPYRTCRPIIPSDPRIPLTYSDLALQGRVDKAGGLSIDVYPLQQTRQAVRVIAVFSPALRAETSWTLEYTSPSLWEALRKTGSDELAWDTSSPRSDSTGSPFSLLRVVFVFPEGTRNSSVSEISGAGRLSREDDHPLGPAVVWEVNDPVAMKFRWEVSCPDLRPPGRLRR